MKNTVATFTTVLSLTAFSFQPLPAQAEDAQAIMDKMEQSQVSRWQNVNAYIKDQVSAGNRMVLFFEKMQGNEHLGFRLVPPHEVQERIAGIDGIAPELRAALLWNMAGAASRISGGMLPAEMGQALQGGLLDGMAMMGQGLASVDNAQARDRADAQKSFMDRKKFGQMAKNVGVEQVNGYSTHHLRAEEINITQTTAQGNYTLKTADLFVDTKKYVPIKMRFDFVEDKTGNMFSVEKVSTDYRSAGSLYEPFKEIMRINPGADGKQAAELEKARREMKKLKEQLDNMPPDQKAMMMQMMGPQMKTMEKMAAGKGIEVETIVKSIEIGGVEQYVRKLLSSQGP